MQSTALMPKTRNAIAYLALSVLAGCELSDGESAHDTNLAILAVQDVEQDTERSLAELVEDLDSRKFAVRRRATLQLIEDSKSDPSLRDRIEGLLEKDSSSPEARYRLTRVLRSSQSVVSWEDAQVSYYEHVHASEAGKALLSENRQLSKLLSSEVIEELEKLNTRIEELYKPIEWEFDRIPPARPGRFGGLERFQSKPSEALLKEAQEQRAAYLAKVLGTMGQDVEKIDNSTLVYKRGEKFFRFHHIGRAVFTVRQVRPETTSPILIDWKMSEILPKGHSLPPKPFPSTEPPLSGYVSLTLSPRGAWVHLHSEPAGYRNLENPVATYFWELYPNSARAIEESALGAQELAAIEAKED